MKAVKPIITVLMILVLLGAGIHVLVRTYVSRKASEAVKEVLMQSFGESISFDALLLDLLGTQAEIENPRIVIPGTAEGLEYFLSADHMMISLPPRDLMKLQSLSERRFETGKGLVSFSAPVFSMKRSEGISPLTISAAKMDIMFSGKLDLDEFSRPEGFRLASVMKDVKTVNASLSNAKISSPGFFNDIKVLAAMLSEEEADQIETAVSRAAGLLPSGAASDTVLSGLLPQADVRIISQALDFLTDPDTDEVILDALQLSASTLSERPDMLSAQGSAVTPAGIIEYDGLLKMLDTPGEIFEQLAMEEGTFSVNSALPEVSALLGGSSFTYTFRH